MIQGVQELVLLSEPVVVVAAAGGGAAVVVVVAWAVIAVMVQAQVQMVLPVLAVVTVEGSQEPVLLQRTLVVAAVWAVLAPTVQMQELLAISETLAQPPQSRRSSRSSRQLRLHG